MPAPQATAIRLADAKGKSSIPPTHYEGAVRVRAVSVEKAKELSRDAGEITLALQVSPEPKLGWQQLVGVSITKAIDDQDQELTSVPMDATANAAPLNMNGARQIMIRQNGNGQQIIIIQNGNGQQQVQIVQMGGNVDQVIKGMTGGTNQIVPVRLKRGTRDTTSLKEVSGVLTAKVRSGQEELLRINDILNAKGMTAKGEGNTSVKVLSVASSEDGDIKIEVELSYNNEVTFEAAQIKNPALADAPVANGAPVPQLRNTQLMGISLKDEKGEPLEAVMQQVSQSMVNNTTMTIKATYMFRPIAKGQTPKSLTLKGSCPTTIEVPFVLKNVQVK